MDENPSPSRLRVLTLKRVPYPALAEMTHRQFKKMQGKLTYVGPKDRKISSLSILTGYYFEAIDTLDHGIGRFDNSHAPGIDYALDKPGHIYDLFVLRSVGV